MVIAQTNSPHLTEEVKRTDFTPDEYRTMEETAAEHHEYCNGEIITMARGSEIHSAIANNTALFDIMRYTIGGQDAHPTRVSLL